MKLNNLNMASKSSNMLPGKIQYKTWKSDYKRLSNGEFNLEIKEGPIRNWHLKADKDKDNNWNIGYYTYGPEGPEDELPKSKNLEDIDLSEENWKEWESFINYDNSGEIKHGITDPDFDIACEQLLKWLFDNGLL